jgi:predicted GIY-YIG superfamily endonuclease
MLREERRYVYILRSESQPSHHYVGTTTNPRERLRWHNDGPDCSTRAYRPWRLVVAMEFPSEPEAVRFERYLKSGSGRAFAKRHFAPAT